MTARARPPSPIDDFHPPYHLGAFGCVILGTWEGAPEPATEGIEVLRLFGRPLGAAMVLRYDRPPPDRPTPYSEVILAHVVRRGLSPAALPFELVLDDPFFVEAGVRYYHLPKRLDRTLQIEVAPGPGGRPASVRATGSALSFEASLEPVAAARLVTPVASALLRIATGIVPVIGAVQPPPLESTIELTPDGAPAYLARGASFRSGDARLSPALALYWSSIEIVVGEPRPFARG